MPGVVLRAFFSLTVLSAALLVGSAAQAAADSRIFEVHDVPVDATAAGATDAREQAFAQGRAMAFNLLLKRLTLKSDWSRLPPAGSPDDLRRLIAGFAVGGEKRSATRYIAKVTYVFVPDRIRAILRGAGIPFSETRSKPVLLLPVLLTADGKRLLWEPENLWAQIWRDKPAAQGLVPMIVPQADPAGAVQPEHLDSPSWAALAPLATPLGASSALVAMLSLRRAGDQLQSDVRLIEVTPGRVSESRISATGPDEAAAMSAAADAIADRTNEAWKQTTVISEGAAQTLIADVSYDGLQDWLRVRRALQAVSIVRGVRVVALSATAAEIEISYVGTSDQLGVGLAQQDLSLGDGLAGHYRLANIAPPPPPAPAAAEGTPAQLPMPTTAPTTPPAPPGGIP
jgi:Uncharacterized protein conserved in bacteria (DUF2066)